MGMAIAGFYRCDAYGGHADFLRCRLEPDRAFLDKFGLQMADSGSLFTASQRANTQTPPFQAKADKSSPSPAPNVFAFSYLEMASCCGSSVDAIKAQEWLQAVIQKLGQAMNQSKRVGLSLIVSCTLFV